jgi:general stress protein YciG
MPGTKAGGLQAAITNKAKYGKDFYSRIGQEGGKKSGTGGFYYLKKIGRTDLLSEYSARGGTKSRRTKKGA